MGGIGVCAAVCPVGSGARLRPHRPYSRTYSGRSPGEEQGRESCKLELESGL